MRSARKLRDHPSKSPKWRMDSYSSSRATAALHAGGRPRLFASCAPRSCMGVNGGSGRCAAAGLDDALCRRRVPREQMRWPDRSRRQIAAAVWTNPCQDSAGAVRTERALEGADGSVRMRWQVAIAAFTVGTKLKHLRFSDGEPIERPGVAVQWPRCGFDHASRNGPIALRRQPRATITPGRSRTRRQRCRADGSAGH